jgi:CheY-like chemotaxis protein
VLVVDDNEDNAHSLALLLEVAGHVAQVAHDGLEALESAERFAPDLVLLDIGLPRLNGFDTCRRIRAQRWGKRIRIVAVTGLGEGEDRRRSAEAGFDAHLVKPVDPAELAKVLEDLPPEAQATGAE